MPRPLIGLVGPHGPLCERAARLGLRVAVFDTAEKLTPAVTSHADVTVAIDYRNAGEVVRILRTIAGDDRLLGVVSLTEPGQVPAAEINAILGVPDNPVETVRRLVDKGEMRRFLADHKQFAIESETAATHEDVRAFAARCGAIVAKPADGAGSLGVVVLENSAEVETWLAGRPRLPILLEERLLGREFSAESISIDGAHTVVGLAETFFTPGRVNDTLESGHVVPADLDGATDAELRAYVGEFLTLVGIRSGLTHTELRLTETGPRIIESHARNGGGNLLDLVGRTTAVDMLTLALRVRMGETPPVRPSANGAAAIGYFDTPAGRVRRIWGEDLVRAHDGVVDVRLNAGPGSVLAPMRSSSERIGHVTAIGGTAAEAVGRVRTALSLLQIDVEGGAA